MDTVPTAAKIACVVSLIGAILTVIGMAVNFEPTIDTVVPMSVFLLLLVLFIATAGAFRETSKWTWTPVLFIVFVTIGITAVAYIGEYIGLYAVVLLPLVSVITLILLAFPSVKYWMNSNKL